MVPYRHPMYGGQRAYNNWHKTTRSVVERTIGLLKQRWRYLLQLFWELCYHYYTLSIPIIDETV